MIINCVFILDESLLERRRYKRILIYFKKFNSIIQENSN